MNEVSPKIKTVLIAALGGEGGGVLSDWTISAIRSAGFLAQGTSIPGVAQRTGATTYYIEYLPTPRADVGGLRPVFALTPIPGRVDVMIASELLEAARAAQAGLISPDRTTLIASIHRVYATSEKIEMTDGRFDSEAALNAVNSMAKHSFLFDMQNAAIEAGTVINAVLFGTLAGSNALGIDRVHFENAIKASGKAVDASLRGFQFGFNATGGTPPRSEKKATDESGAADFLDEFPLELRFIIGKGYNRCLDYQDTAYAETYLARLRDILSTDRLLDGANRHWALTAETARYLALRMTYEDVMRVADLKTRADRFATVRQESRAATHEPVYITEFLKPGPEEICALLPKRLGEMFLSWLHKRGMENRFNVGIYVKSHTISGFLLMRALAKMRVLRKNSWRFAQEEAFTQRWLQAVCDAARLDYSFGIEVAECADLVKGYSDTYKRGLRNFNLIFDSLIEPALRQMISALPMLRDARTAANSDPDGDRLEHFLSTVRI